MSVSRRSAPCASRPFVTTPYREVGGRMQAVVPDRGPCWRPGSPCQVQIRHDRIRSTGIPWGSVAVAFCKNHGGPAFTLYPPGCVPYGREPWVELGPDGSALEQGEGEEACPTSSGYFDAAKEASEGKRWPVDSAPAPPDAVRTTQRRRVARTATILGLETDSSPGPEAVAEVTHLPAGELHEIRGRLVFMGDLACRGREIWDTFVHVTRLAGRALMDRLAVLGHLAGLWGPTYRWRPCASSLLELGRPFWHEGVRGTVRAFSAPTAVGATHDFGTGPPP